MGTLLDELMANAWPAEITEYAENWRLRWTRGLSRRANSALATGGDDVPSLVDRTEGFYRARDAPPMFQVSTASAPGDLAPYLATRGYVPSARTLVATASTAALIESIRVPSGREVVMSPTATDAWFDTYWSVSRAGADREHRAICRDVLLAPRLDKAFVTVMIDGVPAGVGQVVFEAGRAGVQCMATRPSHRRHGVGSTVLRALARLAQERRVPTMYLGVMADNAAARSLYEHSGFTTVHEYWYLHPPSR